MKHQALKCICEGSQSPPTRGAWIETISWICSECHWFVAPHAGGVD